MFCVTTFTKYVTVKSSPLYYVIFPAIPLVDDIWIYFHPILNKFYAKFTTWQAYLQNKSNEQRKSVEEQLNSIPDFTHTPQDGQPT